MNDSVDVDLYFEKNYALLSLNPFKDFPILSEVKSKKKCIKNIQEAANNLIEAQEYVNNNYPLMLMLGKYTNKFDKVVEPPYLFKIYYYIHVVKKYDERYNQPPLKEAVQDFLLSFLLDADYDLDIMQTELSLGFDNSDPFHISVYSSLVCAKFKAEGTFHEVMFNSLLEKIESSESQEINFYTYEEMVRIHNLLHIANSEKNQLSELADYLAQEIIRVTRFIDVITTNKTGTKTIYVEKDLERF
ncbi:hypothetical protein E5672_15985 [Alteromonas portus]|uniref:Uncharacterized protein n=1 Tax=Alteromonas portus TaxID=2565549 RepID=A0A4U0ZBQ9_9ALTE|nr:hypothetical protein [Alteromonas portus]TKB01997.1 hypothetical protein E5672_15985 [Alteromonas portus]